MDTTGTIVPLGNAAGTCNNQRQFDKLLQSAVSVITCGPMSVSPREQNPGGENAYVNARGGSINSKGLPNPGIEWYRKYLPGMIADAEKAGKKLALTVPPINAGDVEILVGTAVELGVRIIELNFGCNHVFVGGVQKDPLCYDPSALGQAISTAVSIAGGQAEIRVKLSLYMPRVPGAVADVIRPHRVTIVTCNTAGNAFMFQDEDFRPAIGFGQRLGGYGGVGMKPIALGQVVQLRKLLPDHRIIGVGGIESGRDLWEFASLGVDEAQIGSAWYFSENARIFGGVIAEYLDIIEEHPLWTPATT